MRGRWGLVGVVALWGAGCGDAGGTSPGTDAATTADTATTTAEDSATTAADSATTTTEDTATSTTEDTATSTTEDTATTTEDSATTTEDTATTTTEDTAATTAEDTATTEDTSGDATATTSVATGALTSAESCAGETLELGFTLEGATAPIVVRAELSAANGSFGSPRVVGTVTASASGTIAVTLPGDLSESAGYRIRAAIGAGPGLVSDAGTGLVVHALPEIDTFFYRQLATTRSTQTVDNRSGGVAWSWDFGSGATPATSTQKEPTWTYATAGRKTVTLTATDAHGCARTEVMTDAIRVLGCSELIDGNAEVVREGGELSFGQESWVCTGADVGGLGGLRLVFVEPGASLSWDGGGLWAAVVRTGGHFSGSTSTPLVYEAGAYIDNLAAMTEAVACDPLEIDASLGPADGCTTPGADPVSAHVTSVAAVCPSTEVAVHFAADGAPEADNVYLLELSDDSGDFAGGEIVGELASAATSGTITAAMPDVLDPTGAYALRIVTTNAVGVGPAYGPLSIPTVVDASFTVSDLAPFAGDSVTVTDTTPGVHTVSAFDFGAGAVATPGAGGTWTVHWPTAGAHTLRLEVTDGNGCPRIAEKTVTVLGCDEVIPATAEVVTAANVDYFNGAGPVVICGGAGATFMGAPNRDVYVLPGGTARNSAGSGASRYYVGAGALLNGPTFNGGSQILVKTPTTLTANLANMQVRTCATMTFDTSALATQCPAFTPVASTLAFGTPSATATCPGSALSVPYTTAGLFAADNRISLLLSDASGSFATPTTLASAPSSAGLFNVTLPGSLPAGTGYKLRLKTTNPAGTFDSAFSLALGSAPTAAFTLSAPYALTDTTVSFTNGSANAVSYAWSFGADASVATSTDATPPAVSWSTPGRRTITLTATHASGCTATASKQIVALSCNPKVPSDAKVITTTGSGSGGAANVWVCDGATYSAGGGSYSIFIEPGGTYSHTGGGEYFAYAPAGATYNHTSGGVMVLLRDPAATVVGSPAYVFSCPGLAFDYSSAPSPGCP